MRVLAILALTLVSLELTAAQGYDDWIQSVDTLGSSIMFTCSKPGIHPEDRTFTENATAERWMLPNLKFLNPNETDGHVSVSEDGTNLTVVNIAKENLGLYHCLLLTPDNAVRMVKWGLNMKGPYFENTWDKYRTNVIIAFSAFGGFLVLVAVIYGVWRFRWIPPPGWSETKAEREMAAEYEMAAGSAMKAGEVNGNMPYPMATPDPTPAIPQYEMPSAAVVEVAAQPTVLSPKEMEAGSVVNASGPAVSAAKEVEVVTVEVAAAAVAYDNMAATRDDGQALSSTAL